jgi:ribose transport system substrate-binding protein
VPSWCGPKKIKLGFTDGFGGNSWRLVTTASARNEAQKCPSVTSIDYADGQGNTQKAISDIQGMVAKGVNALVVFPDAGKAILPALRSSYKAGVVTVPYRVTPGGKGVDYNVFIDTPFSQAGENWGRWIKRVLPKGGNVLMLSGPGQRSQGIRENQGLHRSPTRRTSTSSSASSRSR